ncbi:MAG TPA: serine hydrolase domain-containing protein [Acidimicrobiales bacterium]|jgi:CubicO group peptidase (beta-lactamase class C family)|nr:serine hydrolase domain-containing protein [Acidimicrobiales bacterium]
MDHDRFSAAGLEALHVAMAHHVDAASAPAVVLGLSRGDDVHIDAIGAAPDTLFRITSMTRPVTAAATLLLVEDGRLALDEPVDRLLPELAGRRVLRRLKGPVDDTVAAHRSITVEDLLTFRAGFGMILAPPSDYPILAAEASLQLCSVGPPTPATPHNPDEWIRRLGTLPLMAQPGEQWRYGTGSMILGVLIARAAGQPAADFFRERLFSPLGMDDTVFVVPPPALHRLAPCYLPVDEKLQPFDDGGQWSRRQPFDDCGAGLVSTVRDYLTFARMLLSGGTIDGRRILSPASVAAVTNIWRGESTAEPGFLSW